MDKRLTSSGRTITVRKTQSKKPRINIQRLLIVILGGLLILTLLICGICSLFKTPETIVKKAYAETMKQISKRNSITQELVDEDTLKLINEKSSTQALELNINQTNLNDKLSGTGFTAKLNKDSKKQQGSLETAVTYNNTPVFNINGFTDNKNVLISVPSLSEKVFSMASNNIMEQYTQSVMGQYTVYSDLEDFSINVFSEDKDVEALKIVDKLKAELSNIYDKEFQRLADKMEYKKLEEKQEIEINGELIGCKGYSVTAQSSDVKAFVINVLKEVRTNKNVRSLVEKYAEIQYLAVPLYQMMMDDPDYIVEQYYSGLDEIMADINSCEFNDTSANVYVYKGAIAKIGARSIYTNGDERFVIQLIGGLTGGKKPYADYNFSVNLQDDEQMLKLDIAENTDVVDTVTTRNYTFTIGNGVEDLVFNSSLAKNSADNSFNGEVKLTTPAGNYVSISGKGSVVKEKKAFILTADEINVDYNNIYTAGLSGSYVAQPLEDKIVKPEGDTVEIFKADEATVTAIKEEIAQNINAMSSFTKEATEETAVE